MRSLTYLALLEPGENGSYSISFPDLPGCFSYCDQISEAQKQAEEAASLHIYGLENDGESIPVPSKTAVQALTDGKIMMPVTIFPDVF